MESRLFGIGRGQELDAKAVHGPKILVYRDDPFKRRARRCFDVLAASFLLAIAAPVIAAAAIAILIDDGGPVLFKQRRTGRYERTFTIYKLRSMHRHLCVDAPTPTSEADGRISRVGRFIRKTSVDELPQLFNVIRGDMSLVGPRPELPLMLRGYAHWQQLRHLVLPGITCIWQVRDRGRIKLEAAAATMHDLSYIRNASPALDIALLLVTPWAVLSRRGSC